MTVTFRSGGCCGRSIWSWCSVCRYFNDCPPCKQVRRHHLRVQPRYLQWRRRPIEDVQEESPAFCRGSNRFHVLHWSVSRPVYGFAVNREPIADGPETLLKFRLDQAIRLRSDIQQEVAAKACDFHKAPNEKLRALMQTVEPDQSDRAVFRQQLDQLEPHILEVYGPLGACGLPVPIFFCQLRGVTKSCVVHIGRRVVKPRWNTSSLASVRQLSDNVLPIGSIRDLVVCVGRVEHAKTIVVFGREHHVFLSCGSSQINESIRVEL